jgi:DNA polymerase-4
VKSIGHEETFASDVTDRAELERHVLRFAERVASRLREGAILTRTVQLKARYADFRTITRSRTLTEPTELARDLARVGRELLDDVDLGSGLRLLGLAAQQLVPADGVQPALPFRAAASRDEPGRQHDLERTVDQVRRRFGDDAVTRATGPARR